MARLGTAGLESQFLSTTVGSGPEPVTRNNSNSTISTTNPRSGAACVDVPDAATNYIRGDWTKTANRWFYIRVWFRISALPAADRNIAAINDGGTAVFTVVLKSDGTMYLSGQSGAGSSAAIAANAYHCLEMGVWGDGSSSKRIKLRLDGTQFVDFTSSASPSNYGDQFRAGFPGGGNTGLTIKLDDIAWNDDTGSAQNSWPGTTGKILNLLPTADNAIGTDWKLGTGTTPTGNAYDAVNNVPPVGVSNGAAGSDAKQIRDIINNTSGAASQADLTMQAYDAAGVSGSVDVVQAVAALGQTSNGATMDAELGLVSNPSETRPTVQIPAGAAGTFGSNWQSRYGGAQQSPSVTLSTAPVVRLGKRQAATTALLCCYLALIVEYTEASTTDLTGSSDVAFAASGTLNSTAELVSSPGVAFDAAAALNDAGAIAGTAAIAFTAAAVPPTARADLTSTIPIQFDSNAQLDAFQLFATVPIAFTAAIVPPTGVANLVAGATPITFGAFGELARDIPARLPSGFTGRWASGLHVGVARPGMRVQVRLGRFNRRHQPWLGNPVGVDIPGIEDSENANPWQATWEPSTPYKDIPGVRDCRLEKSTSNRGLTTATLTIDNITYSAETGGYHAIRRGYLSPLRGYVAGGRTALTDEQGATVAENTWFGMLSRQAQITVWQSYGDQEVKVFTGLIDDVDAAARPDTLTVTARCFGQVLADERLFGWNKEPDVKDPVHFVDQDQADNITTVGSDPNASSELGAAYTAANINDGNGGTYWLSAAHTTQGNTEWCEIRLPEGRYEDFYLRPGIADMDAYVCLYAKALANGGPPTKNDVATAVGWQGAGTVPGDNGGIPYVSNPTGLSTNGVVRTLGDSYVVGPDSILRIAFRNLQVIQLGGSPYGASVISLRGRRRRLLAETLERNYVVVEDASDVVRQILRWAGFKEWEVESSVPLSKRFLANRGMTYLDVIQKIADATGYTFFVADPTADENSIGVPVFRKTRAVTNDAPVATITDRTLLTAVRVSQTDEPLAYIIRVRGRESDDGQRLGSDPRRVMFTFRPPWSHQLDEPLIEDRMGGVLKHVVHLDPLFRSVDDCKFGAYYIALQEALESVKVSFSFPAWPGVDLDEHLELLDLATGVTSRVLVTDRSSTFERTGEKTAWTMTIGGSLVDTPDVSDMVTIINAAVRS